MIIKTALAMMTIMAIILKMGIENQKRQKRKMKRNYNLQLNRLKRQNAYLAKEIQYKEWGVK